MEVARQRVIWTTALALSTFPFTRHWVVQGQASTQIDRNLKTPPQRNAAEKREPRLARLRKGEE